MVCLTWSLVNNNNEKRSRPILPMSPIDGIFWDNPCLIPREWLRVSNTMSLTPLPFVSLDFWTESEFSGYTKVRTMMLLVEKTSQNMLLVIFHRTLCLTQLQFWPLIPGWSCLEVILVGEMEPKKNGCRPAFQTLQVGHLPHCVCKWPLFSFPRWSHEGDPLWCPFEKQVPVESCLVTLLSCVWATGLSTSTCTQLPVTIRDEHCL